MLLCDVVCVILYLAVYDRFLTCDEPTDRQTDTGPLLRVSNLAVLY